MKKPLILALTTLLAACNPQKPDAPEPGGGNNNVEPKTPGLEMFYKGGTMCFASYLQDFGLRYLDGGIVTDPYASMEAHGANCVRLQLDRESFPSYGGVTIDWQGFARVSSDAAKAVSEGLQLVLTLKPDRDQFSASSTDHNIIPSDWTSLSEKELASALYDWVYSSLEKLATQKIYPAIVAVGNEVNIGFLRPGASAAADNARTGRLLASGLKAVRDYAAKYNPACLSALHIANPALAIDAATTIIRSGGGDFDILALSYYPGKDIGHSLPQGGFAAIAKAFEGKALMVLETAYTFTDGKAGGKWMGDWCDNAYNFPDWDESKNKTNYTPAACRKWYADLARELKSIGGAGLVTWGTESLPDQQEGAVEGHGKGIYTYPAAWAYGSTWENNSYWDFTDNNNIHEGIDWMKDIN